MLYSSRRRFSNNQNITEALTSHNQLPATLNADLCKILNICENNKLISVSPALTRGVGATQCKPLILQFETGEKRFLKVTPGANCSSDKQELADKNITSNIPIADYYLFARMDANVAYHAAPYHHEFLFFPFIEGDNLYISTNYRYKEQTDKQLKCYEAVGQVLAKMHISCMKFQNCYERFINESNGSLPNILVHDDWQSTNVMITSDFKGVIIDTEGTKLSENSAGSYKNINESWEMTDGNPRMMKAFLSGYLHAYPKDARNKILEKILENFKLKFKKELDEEAIPNSQHFKKTLSTV